jgi:elongation factor Ts
MADINAASIKELREKSGAGMMDCKKALVETGGDMEAAVDWLRTKGLAAAAKKSSRVAAEGLVAVATAGNKGAVVELNAETDFVARNDKFQDLASNVANAALKTETNDVEALKKADLGGKTVEEAVTNAIAVIGENMNLRRVSFLSVNEGVVAQYIHNSAAPGLGKIGVLVALESTGNADKLNELGRQIAMHIAAAKPEALTTADVDPEALERERSVLKEQAIASGKPAEIAEKMVEGRIRKYYEEVVLLEQLYVMDGKTKVREVVEAAAKEIGAPVKVTAYTRFLLGEGVEKEESDFAAEVAAAVNG